MPVGEKGGVWEAFGDKSQGNTLEETHAFLVFCNIRLWYIKYFPNWPIPLPSYRGGMAGQYGCLILFFFFMHGQFRGRIQRKTWCMGPYGGADCNLPLRQLQSRLQQLQLGNSMPESTLSPSQGLRIWPHYNTGVSGIFLN
jgi:hypothetical protein